MYQRAVHQLVTSAGGVGTPGASPTAGFRRLVGLTIPADFPYSQLQAANRRLAPVGDPAAMFPPLVRQPDSRYFQPTWSPRLWVQAMYRTMPIGDPPAASPPLQRPFAPNYPRPLSSAYWTRQARVVATLSPIQVIPSKGTLVLAEFAPAVNIALKPKAQGGAGYNLRPWLPTSVSPADQSLRLMLWPPDVMVTDRGVWVWPDNGKQVIIRPAEPQLITARSAIFELQTSQPTIEITGNLNADDVMLLLSQGWIDEDAAIILLANL